MKRSDFLKSLVGIVTLPTYLYGLYINSPIINPYTFTSEYSFILRMT